jgi:hypothetical protein
MKPIAVQTTLFPDPIAIDADMLKGVDHQWLGGVFGVRLNLGDDSFVVVPADEAARLEGQGVIAPR